MPTQDQQEIHPAFEELLIDIASNEERARKAKALETKHELVENIWPMFEALTKACNTRFEEIEEAMEEMLAEEGNVLYSDLAQPLFGLIEIAKRLGSAILGEGQMTDLRWQQIRNEAQVMLQTVAILEPIAAQAVVQDADDDEEDGDTDEEGDDEDDDDPDGDDDGGEPAAAASEEKTP
jgi:hypothetical protein